MKQKRPPFTWHYYAMAFGALAGMLAATISAWGSLMSAIGFVVLAHPVVNYSSPVRVVLLLIFAVMYIFAFPAELAVQVGG